MKKHTEPFWWSLFGAGGVLSAFFLPVLLFLTGIAFPLGWLEGPSHEHLQSLIQPLISRLLLFGIITFSMFHWAHRFRFTLEDGLQLKRYDSLISVACYGSAILVMLFTGYSLWNF
ncbi:MAG: fumarate reductase subunit FrdD [Bacteroidota bacterium]